MKNKVAIIVVTFNRITLLKECIQSLRDQTYLNRDIIVVNNGSTDNTLEWLNEQNDLIVINQKNVGGAGGFFTGIKYACEHGYTFSWVMDDDVLAEKNALLHLVENSENVSGFLCSRVLDTNNEMCNIPRISRAKSPVTGEFLWGEKIDSKMIRVDMTSFVAMFFNNKIAYEVGLPYKEYFIWGDDSEYSSRISLRYPSYMVLDSTVIHKRKIQAILSIFTEKDKRRLKNYFYAYRNRIHGQHCLKEVLKMLLFSTYELFVLLLHCQFYKSFIVLKGLISSIFFHPKIQFPS